MGAISKYFKHENINLFTLPLTLESFVYDQANFSQNLEVDWPNKSTIFIGSEELTNKQART